MRASDEFAFGKSRFRGHQGAETHFSRWGVQFAALVAKNFLVLSRRPLQLLAYVLLPGCVYLGFLAQIHEGGGSASPSLQPAPAALQDLGACDVYYSSKCVRVAYGPSSALVDSVMQTFSAANDLQFGKDVRGFSTVDSTKTFVAENLGRVQYTVFFRNTSLWETSTYSPTGRPLPKNMSYVIFYNSSENDDPRSGAFGVNFPLLVLQQQLDEAYMRATYPSRFQAYEADYGVFWSVPYDRQIEGANSTNCDLTTRTNAVSPYWQ
jgi:hypothetical protein